MALQDYVGKWYACTSKDGLIISWGTIDGLSTNGNLVCTSLKTNKSFTLDKNFYGLLLFDNQENLNHFLNSICDVDPVVDTPNVEETVKEELPPSAPPLVVAVTGHRPDKLGGYNVPNPIYDQVMLALDAAFDFFKPGYVITGMAIGVDQWAAEICIAKKIPFVAAIPFENQQSKWPPKTQAKYSWILSHAYQMYVICAGSYEPWKMQKRNQWMIDSCQQVIAVWNGSPGGTANCLAYATSVAKPIHYVPLNVGSGIVLSSAVSAKTMAPPTSAPLKKEEEPQVIQGPKRFIIL